MSNKIFIKPQLNLNETIQLIYDFFNQHLFNSELPPIVITLTPKASSRGFYHPDQFIPRNGTDEGADQLNINPASFDGRTDEEIASTIVHEMSHQWHELNGTPGKGGYHNQEWVEIAESLGLEPVALTKGEPNGKKTGMNVTHKIIPDGPFQLVWRRFRFHYPDINISLQMRSQLELKKTRKYTKKTKYECQCSTIWGKPGLWIKCETCGQHFWEKS